MTKLIAFTGHKGSGKDTAGEVFTDYGWRKFSFAEPLKAMVRELMAARGCSPQEALRYTDGDLKEQPTLYLRGRTARHAMQTLGTEWGRNLMSNDLWIDTFKLRVMQSLGEGKGVVVTDVRFPNEVDAVHSLGGKVYRILRPGYKTSGHASEKLVESLLVDGELDNIHFTAGGFRYFIRDFFEDELAS